MDSDKKRFCSQPLQQYDRLQGWLFTSFLESQSTEPRQSLMQILVVWLSGYWSYSNDAIKISLSLPAACQSSSILVFMMLIKYESATPSLSSLANFLTVEDIELVFPTQPMPRKQKNLTFRSKKHFDALISNPEKRRIYEKDVDISRVPLIFHSCGYGKGFYDLPRNDMELLDWLEKSRWSLRRSLSDQSGRLEIYYIEVDADKVTVEECLELLKRIDLCESRFIACSVEEPSLFCADLNKSDVTRLEASNGISRVYPRGRLRVEDAFEVFEGGEGEICDCISYNTTIAGLAGAGRDVEALLMFKYMQKVNLRPTELTFVSVTGLCSCARIAIQVHAQAIKVGYENCTSVRNAAMTMYSTCGELDTAHMVFQEMQEKDIVSWNTIITGYAQGHLAGAAILAYLQMQSEGILPDEFTVGSLLASTEMLVSVEMILVF
ncbi:hypothetical protein POM88_053504 [Heracleum sosnowskyi]|uniref:Pentatricopeptide repeat-containing protein n=1 Tax=Heracleum sosnowskyi TaxID=360622 RepID=A0AAD8GQ90_9APIA|nr:hypothetical protein POM88_053504 [Heracleum sosnowskyi]